jgi:hypothetical protein
MPTIIGSTTVKAKSEATAASTALPPAARISNPAAEPSGWLVTTMPPAPLAGDFSQVNGRLGGLMSDLNRGCGIGNGLTGAKRFS